MSERDIPPAKRRYRLDAVHRLKLKREFTRPRNEGLTYHHRGFLLRFMPPSASSPGEIIRLGVVSSRKVGKAHDRNRARRLMREAFRQTQWEFPGPCDVLMIARSDILCCSLEELRTAVVGFCERARNRWESAGMALHPPLPQAE